MDGRGRAVGVGVVLTFALLTVAVLTTAGDEPEASSQPGSSPSATATTPSPTTSSPPSDPPGPALLLPNMRSLGAGDLQIQVVGERRLLRFSASLANLGPGPLLLRPTRGVACPAGQHPANQLLHRDRNTDGRYQSERDTVVRRRHAGCMLAHPDHDHWHFDAMAAYSLRRPGTTEPLVARDKVSFCLRDNVRVRNQPVVVRREHFGECSRHRRQGISPGWVDIYTADLSGQTLRLPAGPRRQTLCLDLEADPDDLLLETDETDNASSVGIRIRARSVRRVPPATCR